MSEQSQAFAVIVFQWSQTSPFFTRQMVTISCAKDLLMERQQEPVVNSPKGDQGVLRPAAKSHGACLALWMPLERGPLNRIRQGCSPEF